MKTTYLIARKTYKKRKYLRFFQINNFDGNVFVKVRIKPDKKRQQLRIRIRQTQLFLVSPCQTRYKINANQILLHQGLNGIIFIPSKSCFFLLISTKHPTVNFFLARNVNTVGQISAHKVTR